MYGNNFDYTGVQPDVDRSYLQSIMDDTRSTVSGLKTDPVALVEELAASRGDRFDAAGVGNVGDYLEEVYTPYVPNDTPSYSEFSVTQECSHCSRWSRPRANGLKRTQRVLTASRVHLDRGSSCCL